jgi:small acid-soluble spore protein F (minor alpha/beta-type SASP)
MSEELKYELAKDLGFYETVMREGWEGIRTKDAGNMVRRAIQIAEQHLAKQYQMNQAGTQPNRPPVHPPSYGPPYQPTFQQTYQPVPPYWQQPYSPPNNQNQPYH